MESQEKKGNFYNFGDRSFLDFINTNYNRIWDIIHHCSKYRRPENKLMLKTS